MKTKAKLTADQNKELARLFEQWVEENVYNPSENGVRFVSIGSIDFRITPNTNSATLYPRRESYTIRED